MYISLDLETTGFDPVKDKIIEFGAVKFDDKGEIKEKLQFLCNPNIPIPQIVTHITKITDEDLKNTPLFEAKIEEVKEFIKDLPIIGHNIPFDIAFLKSNGIEVKNPEYDTQTLSAILLPELSSHSLEVISHKLKLKHEEKHRALDDAIAAMELFLNLIKKFQQTTPETLEEIKALSQNSDWGLKNLIKDLQPEPTKEKAQKIAFKAALKSNYKKILAEQDSALIETNAPYPPLALDLAQESTTDNCIAVDRQIFLDLYDKIPPEIAKIDAEENYISLKRFGQLKAKKHFQNHEISTVVKVLVWLNKTTTGLLKELKLFGDERGVIEKINLNPAIKEEDTYFDKAFEKSKTATTVCTHEYLATNPVTKNIIILDFEEFMRTLSYKNTQFIKLEYLIQPLNALAEIYPENETIKILLDKCTILFGLIGILFEKHHDPTSYTLRCVIDKNTTCLQDWQQIRDNVNNLIELSLQLGEIKNEESRAYLAQWKEKLAALSAIFREPNPEDNFIWMEPDHLQNLMVQKSSYEPEKKLDEILQNAKNYKLIGENFDLLDEGAFIKKIYGLDQELKIHKSKPKNHKINIIKNLDENDKNAMPNFLEEYFEKNKKKAALIFNSKKQLQFITLKLGGKNIPVISQITGSPGKIRALLAQQKEQCLLLITPRTWEKLEDYSQIDTLFISKLPFDPPSDPELVIYGRKFTRPFEGLQVKRAILKLKNLITRMGDDENKEIYILDSRIVEKNYSGEFLKNIFQP